MNIAVNAKDRQTEKLKLREALTAEIVADVEHGIGDVLTWAPEGVTDEDRKAIRDQVIAQTRLVTDALTTEELQNEGARRSYTCGAVAVARHLINLQMAQPSGPDSLQGPASGSLTWNLPRYQAVFRGEHLVN